MLQSLLPTATINATFDPSSSMRPKRSDRTPSACTSAAAAAAAEVEEDESRARKRQQRAASPAAGDDPAELAEEEEVGSGEAPPDSRGLRLLGLLLQCAEAVAADRLAAAHDLLPEIAELASPFGSSPERVVAYFAEALRGRIVNSFLGAHPALPPLKSLSLLQSRRISQAFNAFNSLSPLVKFSHFTANQAIFRALDGEQHVHIIDLDIMQGLQWPGLFHILASRPGELQSLRLTGLGSSLELLEATGRRLASFAAALGLPFEFHPLEAKIGKISDLAVLSRRGEEEVTVVHWMHHCLYDVTGSDLGAVRVLKALRPKLVTMVEQDMSHGREFLGRFVEALHYYSALFDAVGEGTAAEGGGEERHTVERHLLGREIRNIVAAEGPKRTGEVKVERWGEELRKAGFQPLSLAGSPAAQANLLLGMFPWKGYTLVEDNGCLRLGWKELFLLTASAWESPDGTRD